eukprot:Gregarina_sp_Pseudo_9__4257@NODE_440_length_2826_cov_5_725152_g416_i0_p1_GENE_NODE_440_length_2826_cov_5_725152_g416_i0NODE_440_length_2826_cov_5_725152_g416_i0_p1_ORF_typecomplete_len536_score89_10UNC93/PF05978_16/1_7e16UNC93/PF05978_16/6e02MFS_1/PF07690_16/1_5e02MFS_1/PF07690_16/2e13MFS_1/PF07690_16/2_7e03PMD/PF10536_9/0_17TMEM223/PF14640_6/2e03TMEM223/PF14640_6/0_81TMEM223/PF14640_6/6_1e03_NODE_440_length_2826_cov_5_725152_g416_i010292636
MKCSLRWWQIVLCAFLAFASQGVWNALNALGGGGTKEIATATKANTILNASCFGLGWMSGGIVNMVGPRLGISFGVCSCALILTFFYCYAYHRYVPEWTVLLGAAIDGLGNTCMWCSLGTVLMFYPKESEKGKALSVFNLIFNMGGVGGAVIALCLNIDARESNRELVSEDSGSLTHQSYLAIVCITYAGLLLSFCLVNPVRFVAESARVALEASPGAMDELKGLWATMKERTTLYMALLYCMTIWHEVVLYNWINAHYHNVRSRAFNSMLYWLARMVFTLPLQFLLDRPLPTARTNGTRGALYMVGVLVAATLLGVLVATLKPYKGDPPLFDLRDKEAGLTMAAMILYGGLDTVAQGMVIWIISEYPGANPGSVARHSGLFRSLQGFGSMIAWSLDINHWLAFRIQFIVTTALWLLGLPGLFYVLRRMVSPFKHSHSSIAEMPPMGKVSFFAPSSARMMGSMADNQMRMSMSSMMLPSSRNVSVEMSPGAELFNKESNLKQRQSTLFAEPAPLGTPSPSFLTVPRQTLGGPASM